MTKPVLNADFIDFLTAMLSVAIGPIAAVIVEEEMHEFNNGSTGIPLDQAAEFVDYISRQILRIDKRVAFQRVMVKKIKEIDT